MKFRVLPFNFGPGTSVLCPEEPLLNDRKSFNIMINIRGLSAADTLQLEDIGLNAIVVTAEAGGIGETENKNTFGNAEFVNKVIQQVTDFMQKRTPQAKLNKLGLTYWSGGYEAVRKIIDFKEEINHPINAVVGLDGMHYTIPNSKPVQVNPVPMLSWIEFAMSALRGETQYILVHTAVKPDTYVSTTQTADYLLNRLAIKRAPILNANFLIKTPVTFAQSANFICYQLYNKLEPYLLNGKPNAPGTMGYEHIIANKFKKDVWQIHLIPTWNTVNKSVIQLDPIDIVPSTTDTIDKSVINYNKPSSIWSTISYFFGILLAFFSKKK